MKWGIDKAVLLGATLIAASILLVERYQISAVGYAYAPGANINSQDTQVVYRLDRWTGRIEGCGAGYCKDEAH